MNDTCIYFIQADESGPIKIGYTAGDPRRRLNQLQTSCPFPLKLLGAIKGSLAREKEFHETLAQWRQQGEWFESHPTVLAVIQDALAAAEKELREPFYCSFCGQSEHQVDALIAAPHDIFICNECVVICLSILNERYAKKQLEAQEERQSSPAEEGK